MAKLTMADIPTSPLMAEIVAEQREKDRIKRERDEEQKRNIPATEQKMVDFNYVPQVHKDIRKFFDALEQWRNGSNYIKANYNGNLREEKIKEHNAAMPTDEKPIAEIEQLTQIYYKHLDNVEADSLKNATKLDAFKLLDLPVIFTIEELQTLHDENADNKLFCRALTEYYKKNAATYGNVVFDFRDGVAVRRELLEGFHREMISLVRSKDDYMLKFYEASSYFEAIDAKFKGNGLYKQPEIVEAEEDSEKETFQAPLPDEFEKQFRG